MNEGMYTSPTDEDLLPIGDAAKLLGVSVATVRRWNASGHLPAARTPGGQRRFRRADVNALRATA